MSVGFLSVANPPPLSPVLDPAFTFTMPAVGLTDLVLVAKQAQGGGAGHSIPAGAQVGDFCLIFNYAIGNPSGGPMPASVLPVGFTEIYDTQGASSFGGFDHEIVSGKILTQTDLDETNFTYMSGVHTNSTQIFVYRPDVSITGFTASDLSVHHAGVGNPANQRASVSGAATQPVMAVGGFGGNSAGGGSMSPTPDDVSTSGRMQVGCHVYAVGEEPIDVNYDGNDNGSGGAFGIALVLEFTAGLANFVISTNEIRIQSDLRGKGGNTENLEITATRASDGYEIASTFTVSIVDVTDEGNLPETSFDTTEAGSFDVIPVSRNADGAVKLIGRSGGLIKFLRLFELTPGNKYRMQYTADGITHLGLH